MKNTPSPMGNGEVMDGLILAGGKSSRMGGKHKGFLMYDEETFMERLIKEIREQTEYLWISYGTRVQASYEGCSVVLDRYPGCGPIGGIQAGLGACRSEVMCVAACDMPFLKAELFTYLYDRLDTYDGAVPIVNGRMHPLAAVYKKKILPILTEQIETCNYRLTDALKRLNIVYVDVSDNVEFVTMLQNINTIEEYRRI